MSDISWLTFVLVAKNIAPAVSGNEKTTSSSQSGLEKTAGKKRKNEPQVSITSSTQDAEQAPSPPKKKRMKATIEPSQPSATTERDNNNAQLDMGRMKNSAKKHPVDNAANPVTPVRPAKRAKVDKPAALTNLKAPIRRTGKIIWH